jgi:hypothetical protein
MATATNYALLPAKDPVAGRLGLGLSAAARDVWHGVLVTAQPVLVAVGGLVLVAGVMLTTSQSVRDEALARLLGFAPLPTELIKSVAVDVGVGLAESGTGAARQSAAEPAQENVSRYLSRRYRVAEGAVRKIVAAAYTAGKELRIDPTLILGVVAVESSLNPFAQSAVGAQGLMQVMTRVHSDKFESHGGEDAALDPIANIKVGSQILSDLIRRGGSIERGLQLYVGAGNLPDDGGYAARVLGESGRIRLAAAGKINAALAAGWRSDLRPDPKPAASAILPVSDPAGQAAPPVVRPAT